MQKKRFLFLSKQRFGEPVLHAAVMENHYIGELAPGVAPKKLHKRVRVLVGMFFKIELY